MSFKATSFAALSISAIISLTSTAALADPIGSSEANTRDWRAFFSKPEYNKPCPLTVYSEDLSIAAPLRRAALSPMPAPVGRSAKAASDIVGDYARGPGFIGIDDLATYDDDFSRLEPR